MANVPRISDITGKKPSEDVRNERDWKKASASFKNDTSRYGFGSDKAKQAWRRRIEQTRSY